MQGVPPFEGHRGPQWDQFSSALQASVSVANWQKWLSKLEPEFGPGKVTLVAPNEFTLNRVVKHSALIESLHAEVFGTDSVLNLVSLNQPLETPTEPIEPEIRPENESSMLYKRYRFEHFIMGDSNAFAYRAAMAVADQPGLAYNPLFIFGGAGLGKTHLLHAIGHHVRDFHPSKTVRYVTSEKFLNDFIDGIRHKRVDDFKSQYRSTDVLLLDDVQFFEGKEQILEEFFHTFNTLHQMGRQMVISSDRHPRNLATVEDRLRSRFQSGLVTDIQPPALETRMAILRLHAELGPKPVPVDVLEYIAVSVSENIRELEGALIRVTAFAALTNRSIDLDMAQQVLGEIALGRTKTLEAFDIIRATGESYGYSVSEVQGPSRRQPLVTCRQIAMYLCRELTDLSLPKIGQAFGGRDHATVIHSVEKVKRVIRSDLTVYNRVQSLSASLRK